MQTTMNLLAAALEQEPAPYWTERLNLARTTINTAKTRGHLSPAIAGALAHAMGQDVEKWIVIAALESERESACWKPRAGQPCFDPRWTPLHSPIRSNRPPSLKPMLSDKERFAEYRFIKHE